MYVEICIILLFVTNSLFSNCVETMEEIKEQRFLFGYKPTPSPINLVRSSLTVKKTWNSLRFSPEHSLKQKIEKNLNEDGLDVTFTFDGKKPRISGADLLSSYEFEKLFLHWDNDVMTERGSYHTVDGQYFAMELQAYYTIIAANNYLYTFFPFLQSTISSTVIISQLFRLDQEKNNIIEKIITGSKPLSLDNIIPTLQEYATYRGSLVTSPFTEKVTWIIPLDPQTISKVQLDWFRNLAQTEIHEARPIQPLYERRISYIIPWQE